jgi:glucose/arabinose dehydrogenase
VRSRPAALAAALAVAAAGLVACGAGGEDPPRDAAPAQRAGVRLVPIGSFSEPVYVTAPRGDRRRVFVVERGGRIRVVRGGRVLREPFLDLTAKTRGGGEQGLLSMAFAPDYASSGRFYVDYTDLEGDTRVEEYTRDPADPDRAAPASARLVLGQAQPEPNHNGGLLLFGPDDLLYVGLGDGGGGGDRHGPRGNAQNLGTWLGKILRIDPRAAGGRPYTVPASNPFTRRAGARPEIYALGLRNPWRFSFDRATGDLSVADVGQEEVEEVSFRRRGRGRGANFGWRVFEGSRRYTEGERAPGAIGPVIERLHEDGNCSITGGVVVRDPGLPALRGRYVFGDFCDGRILSARLGERRATGLRSTGLEVEGLTSFGEDAGGRVYATSIAGRVYRLAPR